MGCLITFPFRPWAFQLAFTRAFTEKREDSVSIFGGVVGENLVPLCYHINCDRIDNTDLRLFDEMSDVVSHNISAFSENVGLAASSFVSASGQGVILVIIVSTTFLYC